MFLGALTLAFGGVPKERFDPCILTISGCNGHTTKAPTTTASNVQGSDNKQIYAKLVSQLKYIIIDKTFHELNLRKTWKTWTLN